MEHGTRMREIRNACKNLVRKPESKSQLGRPRRKFKGNITVNLKEVGFEHVKWIRLAQNREQ